VAPAGEEVPNGGQGAAATQIGSWWRPHAREQRPGDMRATCGQQGRERAAPARKRGGGGGASAEVVLRQAEQGPRVGGEARGGGGV
jgi:hypothetical protein